MKGDNKRTAILIVTIAIAAAFWIVASAWMHSANRFDNWTGMVFSGGLLVVTGSALALSFLLLSRGPWAWAVILGVVGSFLAINGFGPLLLAGSLAAAVFWYWSAHNAARELVERRTIRITSILVHSLPKVLLGVYILLSFAFYLTPASQHITKQEATKALQDQIASTYKSPALASELSKLPPSQRAQVEREVSNQAVQVLTKFLNFQLCLGPGACTPTMLQMLPPLYAFLFFLTIWSFGFIFRELGVLVGGFLFTFLRGLHVVSIEQEDSKVDVLRI